ncbi:hypothetical protein V6N13_087765 [Hibiscus sabdariffa]|uniref:Uncharacterized protein n=1 Tax=Hibiscus sabdariffa TaxID=183260 RepID=A0ABR2FY48_9ROSI
MRIDTKFAYLLVILIFGFIIFPTESRFYGDLYLPPTLASQADRVLNVGLHHEESVVPPNTGKGDLYPPPTLANQADPNLNNGVHPQEFVVPSNIGRGGLYPPPTLAN